MEPHPTAVTRTTSWSRMTSKLDFAPQNNINEFCSYLSCLHHKDLLLILFMKSPYSLRIVGKLQKHLVTKNSGLLNVEAGSKCSNDCFEGVQNWLMNGEEHFTSPWSQIAGRVERLAGGKAALFLLQLPCCASWLTHLSLYACAWPHVGDVTSVDLLCVLYDREGCNCMQKDWYCACCQGRVLWGGNVDSMEALWDEWEVGSSVLHLVCMNVVAVSQLRWLLLIAVHVLCDRRKVIGHSCIPVRICSFCANSYKIFIYCNWVVTRWQWLFYMYTKYEIGY